MTPVLRRLRFGLPVVGLALAACTGSTTTAPVVPVSPTSAAVPVVTTSPTPPTPSSTSEVAGIDIATTDDSVPDAAIQAGVPHPLDGLSAVELAQVRQVLVDAGLVTDTTRYPYVGLHPPDKATVLAWQAGGPIPRQADVVLHDLASGAVTTALVDVGARTLVSSAPAPDLVPGYVNDEFSAAITAAQSDERMIAGLTGRGVDPDSAQCLAFGPGAARAEAEVGRRLLRIACFQPGADGIGWSRPIDGLVATVALDGGATVLSVDDSGGRVASASGAVTPPARAALAAVEIAAPATPNAAVTTNSAEWAGWRFRWRLDRRVGLVLADVSIDGGWGRFPVLYEASLGDMYVPYQDPDPAWSWRTFLDAGEFGLGSSLTELTPGVDCPEVATFVPAAVPNDRGDAYTVARAVCLFERPTGSPSWRHVGGGVGTSATGELGSELVLRTASTVGNYDYLTDVVFGLDGSIRFEVAAAGVVLQRTTAATPEEFSASGKAAHGSLVAPGLVGVHHDHFLNYRLDLDVGGPVNRFVDRRLVATPVDGDLGRSAVWSTVDEPLSGEAGLGAPAEPGSEVWRIESSAAGAAPTRPAYVLDPMGAIATPIADDEASLASRAAWVSRPLWITAYDPGERFTGGASLPSPGAGRGVVDWVADGGSTADADLVAWFTVGFHHIVRAEDLPTMPVHRATFALVPDNVFPSNPLLRTAGG